METVGDIAPTSRLARHGVGPRELAAISLIAGNAGMLLLFFALDLTLFQLVVVYWFEAIWIGLFSGLKLVTASIFGDPYENRWVEVSKGSILLMSGIAIAKSAGAYSAIFILTGVALVVANEGLTGVPGNDFVSDQGPMLLTCSIIFFLGHCMSFVANFLIMGEFRKARFGTLLWLPFKRSIALFVTIVLSLTAIQVWPGYLSATTFPLLLISVKLAWDWFLHSREREAMQ